MRGDSKAAVTRLSLMMHESGGEPPHSKLFDVQDFLQRIDVGIDEQAAIDLQRGVRSEVERLAVVLLGARHLVRHMVL